jgi:hypothetical protein
MANEMAILQIAPKLWLVRSLAVKVGSIAADMTRWPMMAIMSWASGAYDEKSAFQHHRTWFLRANDLRRK